MANKLIYKFIQKKMMQRSPGITSVIPDSKKVTFSADHLEKRLINFGVDPALIKTENELNHVLSALKQAEDAAFNKKFGNILKGNVFEKTADVVDLTGKKIDTRRPIRGGQNIPETEKGFIPIRADQYRDLFGKSPGVKEVKETEAQILERLNRQNKETIERIKNKKVTDPEDPQDFARGGRSGTGLNYLLGEDDQNFRVPFEKGKKVKKGMTRRAFLKTAAGLASLPFVGKFFKVAKLAKPATVTELTRVPIKSGIDGMPAWFKPLVNKVIKEGTEIDSGAERVIVHKAKLPKSKTDVIVEQDLVSGDVRVDLGLEKHGFADGKFGQPVRLEYKASELIEPDISPSGKYTKKGGKTKEEFNVEEAEFTGGHPENVKFEESVTEKFGDHASDFREVEEFAIGKNTIKGQIGGKLKPRPMNQKDIDFASGGIARMLGE